MSNPNEEQAISAMRKRLAEAEQTLEAIQAGSVDAVVVHGPRGSQIFALESPDQPFRALLESIQGGALTVSDDGTILYANPYFAGLMGKRLHELIGTPFCRLVAPEDEPRVRELLDTARRESATGNFHLCSSLGSDVPVQLTLSPLGGSDTPICSGIVFDLRERLAADDARAAREAAEQASAAKDRFLAMLSHELRSPLNTVLGWAEVLARREDLDASARRAVAAIERNARVQAGLIEELLDLSRIVSGKLHLDKAVVDFKQIVAHAVAETRSACDKAVEIEVELSEHHVYVHGDAARLQQIITNLLENAVKFSQPGSRVEVSLYEAGDEIVLVTCDQGAGIPEHELPFIFESFRQTTIGAKKAGLGLGLTIVKELVEAHDGTIAATSAGPDRGATFEVRLPRVAAPSKVADSSPPAVLALKGIGVLVVDDDSDTLELMRHILQDTGAHVHTASSAKEALEHLETNGQRVCVLLSDIGLPEQDGLGLVREIRRRGFSEECLAAIALSGFAGADDVRTAYGAGFQFHLRKPVSLTDLLTTVARAVKHLPISHG